MDAKFDEELVQLMNDPFYRDQYDKQQREAIVSRVPIILKDRDGNIIKTLKIVPAYASR